MPWFKVDDGMHSHPKTIKAGTAAIGLWARCGSWSSDELQDGFVPTEVALHFGTRAMCKSLVRAGLWVEVEGGYQFHDWGDRNPLKEHVEAVRESKRKAGQAGGIAAAKARAEGKQAASESLPDSKQSAKQNGQRNPSPGPGPVVSGSLRDGPELADAHETQDHQEAEEQLALTVQRLQPAWRLTKIREVIAEGRKRNGGLGRLTPALLIVAVAEDSQSPKRVLSDGYWWNENDTRYTQAIMSPKITAVLEPAT